MQTTGTPWRRGSGRRGSGRRGSTRLILLVAVLAALVAVVVAVTRSGSSRTTTPLPIPKGSPTVGTFRYGFDLTTQAPEPATTAAHDEDAQFADSASSASSARSVLSHLHGAFVDQSIFGFGADVDPEPRPGDFDMTAIAPRLALIEAAGDTPVITLVSAPNWMKDHAAGRKKLFDSPPTPDHYEDFAALAAHVAQTFPQVHYFSVWSELRGFFDKTTHNWGYQDYTDMYNDVYRAIKKVEPADEIGGPYAVMTSHPDPVRNTPSTVHGPWGYLDQGMLDTVSYWITHKVGAQYIAVDGATEIAATSDARINDAVTAAEQYAAVDRWIRSQTNLPIWWMESHIQPRTGWTSDQAAAARIATLAEMASSGASVGMQWQPQEQPGWPDEGLWTSTAHNGGGQPTPLAKILPTVLPVLEGSPTLSPGQPKGVLVFSDAKGTVAVNTLTTSVTADLHGSKVDLGPAQVLVRT